MMMVTAFIKYDLFPFYVVLKGELQENFDVKTECGTYNHKKVLSLRPITEYEQHSNTLRDVCSEYHKREENLKTSILREFGVNFFSTGKL